MDVAHVRFEGGEVYQNDVVIYLDIYQDEYIQ